MPFEVNSKDDPFVIFARRVEEKPTMDERAHALIREISYIDDLAACFDLRAFPLPMRVAKWDQRMSFCMTCSGRRPGLHVCMRILPRNNNELPFVVRDPNGMFELNTCTGVTQDYLEQAGCRKAVELVRLALKNMCLHELYEAVLFRGERIMDPHNEALRPSDQPF